MPRSETTPAPTETSLPLPTRRAGGAAAPLYRVIEVTRDAGGRIMMQGRIWHSDLDRLRRFGRALAANSQSHRVVIADGQGGLVEEIRVAAPDQRQPLWGQWQQMPLPPMPPAPGTSVMRPAPRQAPPKPARPQPQPRQLPQAQAVAPAPARQPPRDIPRLSQALPAGPLPPAPPPRD